MLALLNPVLASPAATVLFVLLVIIALIWLKRHGDVNRGVREPMLTAADAPVNVNDLPRLSVLVAAKDEEENIAACLDGLLAQQYPELEIIVINDRSSDRTAAIIEEYAAREDAVRTLHVGELPAGWFGKPHAMHEGVQVAGGEYVCFVDADCRFHDRRLLAAAVGFVTRESVDFLSVLPQLDTVTFWERVVQPPAGAILVYWFPPEKVNDPRSSRAYANGAFMLTSRRVYDEVGGHAGIRGQMHEDMALAREVKRHGLRLHVIRSAAMYSVRMYSGFGATWQGWTRIFYGCFASVGRIVLSIVVLSIFSLLPYVVLAASPLLGSVGPGLALASGAAVVSQQSLLWRFYGLCRMRPAWALTYPLGAALCVGMMFGTLPRFAGRPTVWRGTSYTGGA